MIGGRRRGAKYEKTFGRLDNTVPAIFLSLFIDVRIWLIMFFSASHLVSCLVHVLSLEAKHAARR